MIKIGRNRRALDTTLHKQPIPDYLQDPRKIKAAQVLGYTGYSRDSKIRGAVNEAAREAEVSRQTIYNWLDDDPMFVIAIEETKYELCALAVSGLRQLAEEGNASVCMFLAERLLPETYSLQFKKFGHEKEMLALKAKLKLPMDEESTQIPTIIIETLGEKSPDYERNKL